MDYNIVWDAAQSKISKYEQSAGYFNVNNGENTTMTVKFSGAIYDEESESIKVMRMTKTFSDIAAKQWRQIKFIKKINLEGNATFDIVLDEYVEDNPLGEDLTGSEESMGADPNAPKGDGGIKLVCTEGPAAEILTAWNEAVQTEKPTITISSDLASLKFNAEVPNGVYEFYVDITSSNDDFNTAVKGITVNKDGRIYLTKDEQEHRKVIDGLNLLGIAFPYPENVINKNAVAFDLTNAIPALKMYAGTHTFAMYVTDITGCKHQDESGKAKPINLTVIVEE